MQAPAADVVRAELADAGGTVRRYLFGMGAAWDEAEDLTQEAMLKAWRARASFDGRANVRTWVFTIARNHWRDRLRRRKNDPVAPRVDSDTKPRPLVAVPASGDASTGTPLGAAMRSELADAVSIAMRKLPGEQREALALRESGGLSFNEIGRLLDVSPNTVKSRVRYALLKLADELRPFAPQNAGRTPPDTEQRQ